MIRGSLLTVVTLVALVAVHGDAKAGLIGVTFNNPAPANWGTLSGNGSLNNLTDVNGNPTGIDLTLSGVLDNIDVPTAASSIPTNTPPLPAFTGNVFTAPTTFGPLVVTFSGLSPGTLYGVYEFGARRSATINQTVTITGGGPPLIFADNTTPADTLSINGQQGSNLLPLTDYLKLVTSSPIGTITISINAPNAAVLSGVALDTNPSLAVVPEPSALVVFGSALLALAGYSWRRKAAGQHG